MLTSRPSKSPVPARLGQIDFPQVLSDLLKSDGVVGVLIWSEMDRDDDHVEGLTKNDDGEQLQSVPWYI